MRALALLPLLVLLATILVGCDGEAESPEEASRTPMPILTWFPTAGTPLPTPARTVPAIDGEIPFCGVSIKWWRAEAPNTAARECFLEAMSDDLRLMLDVDSTEDEVVVVRFLVAEPRSVRGIELTSTGMRDPQQTQHLVTCDDLVATGDEWVFEDPECEEIEPFESRFDPALAPDVTQYCGISLVLFTYETAHEAARRCFLDAFEAGASAQLFEVGYTVEGDPIATVLSTEGGVVEAYHDSHDSFGLQGERWERCTELLPAQPPLAFSLDLEHCVELRSTAR